MARTLGEPMIRLGVAADAKAIAAISCTEIEYGLEWGWTPQRVLRALRNRGTNVAVAQERKAGLVAFGIIQYGKTHAHLLLLGVHRGRRRRGLARHLLQWLETCARTAMIERVQVEARADNPVALAFYAAQGYAQTARLSGYYQRKVDAIRMEKRLL